MVIVIIPCKLLAKFNYFNFSKFSIVSGGEDGCIYFMHVDATSTTTRRVPAHATAVLSVAVNYNGAILASGDKRGIIMLWTKPTPWSISLISWNIHINFIYYYAITTFHTFQFELVSTALQRFLLFCLPFLLVCGWNAGSILNKSHSSPTGCLIVYIAFLVLTSNILSNNYIVLYIKSSQTL